MLAWSECCAAWEGQRMQLLSFHTDYKGKRFLEGSSVCHVGVLVVQQFLLSRLAVLIIPVSEE